MTDLKRRIVAEFSAQNKAKGVMAGFTRDIDTVGRAMRRMAMGALAVAGIGGIGYMIKRQMEVIDVTAKLSARIGMATEDIVALQHAAQISGMESEAMNKAMETFVRRLGEVRMGVGQAKYSLEALGLSADALVTQTPWEALKTVADRINALETASDRSAAAAYLFGNRAKEIMNLLQQGSRGIQAYRKEVKLLGLAFSEIDAAQVQAANDALTRARAVLTGLFRQATIQLAPYIEVLATKFVDVATAGEGVGANVVNAFEAMSKSALYFGQAIQGASVKFKAFQAGILEGYANILAISPWKGRAFFDPFGLFGVAPDKSVGERIKELRTEAERLMDSAGEEAEGLYGQLSAVEKFYDDLRKKAAERQGQRVAAGKAGFEVMRFEEPQWLKDTLALNKMTEAQEKAGKSMYEMMMKARGLGDELKREKEITEFAALAKERYGADTEAAAVLVERFKKALEKTETLKEQEKLLVARADAYRDIYGRMGRMTEEVYRAQSEALETLRNDYLAAGVAVETLTKWYEEQAEILQIEYLQAIGGVAGGFRAAGMQIEREVKTWGEIAYEFSMTFQDSIARGLENTRRDFDKWKEHLLNVFEEVYWAALRIAFIQPTAAALAGGMTAGIGALTGALFAAKAPVGVSTKIEGGASWGAYQHGGIARRPQLAMVGEVPEAFVPLSGGRSIPVEIRSGGGDERTTRVEIHNETGVTMEISKVEEYILSDERIIQVVINAMQTNLKLRRSIGDAAR